MTRQDKVFKAFELLKQGQELLEEAGFKLIFDSYNDNGAYAVPKEVDFPDDFAVETGECEKSFENCFCVSMNSNTVKEDDYVMAVRFDTDDEGDIEDIYVKSLYYLNK